MDDIKKETEQYFRQFLTYLEKTNALNNEYLAQPQELEDVLPFIKLKLSMEQIAILWHFHEDKPMSMGEIVRKMGICRQLLSKPIKGLIDLGILNRFQKNNDYRFVYVEITEYGKQLLNEQHRIRVEYLLKKFSAIACAEEIKKLAEYQQFYYSILSRLENPALAETAATEQPMPASKSSGGSGTMHKQPMHESDS